MAVTPARFRRLALALPDTSEGEHMDHPDFRCNGRIFATLQPDQRRGMVKLLPAQQQHWLGKLPAALEPASGAWGRAGCTMVDLAAVGEGDLGAMLTEAWQNAMAMAKKRSAKK